MVAMRVGWIFSLALAAAGCGSIGYTLSTPGEPEEQLPDDIKVRVVTGAHAARAGLHDRPLVVRFDGPASDRALVAAFLQRADALGARFAADVTLVERNGYQECRSAVVPEEVVEETQRAATTRVVSTRKPVTRLVTQREYRCRTVFTMETGGPQTRSDCGYETNTNLVTEDQVVRETEHIPARTDTRRRKRLHVLEPVCTPTADTVRRPPYIEARIFVPVTAMIEHHQPRCG